MEMQNVKSTSFSDFVKQMNELFGDPVNDGGSPNYPAGDFAASDTPATNTTITMNKKNRNRYVRPRR
jgi:hypothetical protein